VCSGKDLYSHCKGCGSFAQGFWFDPSIQVGSISHLAWRDLTNMPFLSSPFVPVLCLLSGNHRWIAIQMQCRPWARFFHSCLMESEPTYLKDPQGKSGLVWNTSTLVVAYMHLSGTTKNLKTCLITRGSTFRCRSKKKEKFLRKCTDIIRNLEVTKRDLFQHPNRHMLLDKYTVKTRHTD
jgi:hypothetical protein